jgi:hypothetical protein
VKEEEPKGIEDEIRVKEETAKSSKAVNEAMANIKKSQEKMVDKEEERAREKRAIEEELR